MSADHVGTNLKRSQRIRLETKIRRPILVQRCYSSFQHLIGTCCELPLLCPCGHLRKQCDITRASLVFGGGFENDTTMGRDKVLKMHRVCIPISAYLSTFLMSGWRVWFREVCVSTRSLARAAVASSARRRPSVTKTAVRCWPAATSTHCTCWTRLWQSGSSWGSFTASMLTIVVLTIQHLYQRCLSFFHCLCDHKCLAQMLLDSVMRP